MTAPNFKNLTTVIAAAACGFPTTSLAAIIDDVPVGHAYVIEAIYVANVSDTTAAQITVVHRDASLGSPSSDIRIAYKRALSIKNAVNILGGRALYLAEGDSLLVQANVSGIIEVDIPYTSYTDL